MNPKVSIIIPNYNHAPFLVQRLNSVFNQTYQDFEVIILDDCSTDSSRDVLSIYSQHPKVSHCVFNETNSGNTFKQWAKGLSLAKGDLIWIAETDDYCEANFLEKLVQPFQKDSEVVLAYCQSNRVNEQGVVTGNWITHTDDLDTTLYLSDFNMDSNTFIERFLICKNVIPNASAVVFRKEAVDLDQHFDIAPQFRYCGDWMFYFKLIVNKKVAFVSDSLNNFRYHSTSVIATAVQSENILTIIDIDYAMRKVLINYLEKQSIRNLRKIKTKNFYIKRNYLRYEKSLILIRTGNKILGYLLLMTVFDVFCKRYKIRKNLFFKLKKMFQ